MNFTVTGRRAAARYDFRHVSALSALDQAMSLAAGGMADVLIVDCAGRARTPAALYSALFGPRDGERPGIPGAGGTAIPTPLAA